MLSFLRRRGEVLPSPREGRSVAFDLIQDGNEVTLRADGIDAYFLVEGIRLPAKVDASFAVWALLPMAMQEGFDLHIKQPIDPKVAANAELVSQIWEMWVPNLYRSVKVSGEGDWARNAIGRRPLVQLFSGGDRFDILDFEESKANRQWICRYDLWSRSD